MPKKVLSTWQIVHEFGFPGWVQYEFACLMW